MSMRCKPEALSRRRFPVLASAAGLTACRSGSTAEHAIRAGEDQTRNQLTA
jgi:hypothetical protein